MKNTNSTVSDFENRSRKANLAKLLASENISVVHKNIPTAYFDVKNRILGLPNWDNASKDVFDLLVGHEVGHALYTPSERQTTFIESVDADNAGVVHSYINVIEDARIERKIKRKFSGLRKNFYKGYQELLERDFFGTATRSTDSYGLIDRINLHYKVGTLIDVPFSDDEQIWLQRIDNAETFESVLDIVRDLYNSKDSETDNHDSGSSQSDSDDFEQDGDSSEDRGDNLNIDDSDVESGSEDDSGSGDDSEQSENNSASDSSDNSNEGSGSSGTSGSPSVAETETALADSISDEFINENAVESVYGTVPSLNSSDFIRYLDDVHSELSSYYTDLYRSDYITFKKSVSKTVNYLAQQFELKKNAEALARASVAKTGVIDINKLHSYKFNEDLFKRVTTVPNGKNHGLLLFVDWSSSFANSIGSALERVIEIALFCRKVGIPFDIYAFSDYDIRDFNIYDDTFTDYLQRNYKVGDLTLGNVRLLHLISSSVKPRIFDSHLENVYSLASTFKKGYYGVPHAFQLGGTPLNECIILANDVVAKFRTKYGVEIINTVFVTDGESSLINGVLTKEDDRYGIKSFGTGSIYSDNISSILEDKVTRKNYTVNNRSDVTNSLLLSLSDRHNVNTIGYFIGNSRGNCNDAIALHAPKKSGESSWSYKRTESFKNYSKELTKNKFVALEHDGYTEFFVIKGGADLDVEDSGFNVEDGLSKRKLATAFKKHSKSKLENRVLLSRFIELIA